MSARLTHTIVRLQRFVDRFWYPPLLGFLAAIDVVILIVPTDGLVISSTMLTPKRWIPLAVFVALGSSLGSLVLAGLVEIHGLPWVLGMYPGIDQTPAWLWSVDFFQEYGLFVVFLTALSPVVQQPAVILASLANTPLTELALVIVSGRLLKYVFLTFVASHAPRLIRRLWGLKKELKEVGINGRPL